jgi:hypothetical protein
LQTPLGEFAQKPLQLRKVARKRRYSWALALSDRAWEYPLLEEEWAWLQPRLRGLSELAHDGIAYAAELASNARERRREAFYEPPYRLTMRDVGEPFYANEREVSRAIKQARIELFGRDLSDNAIDYRRRHQHDTQQRICKDPTCPNRLPPEARSNRRYCATHGAGRARTRRCRVRTS